jgi:protein-S-isoprenylcysteine O-methyltransferase Ste14
MSPSLVFLAAWVLWALSWMVAAAWTGQTRVRAPFGDVWLYRTVILLGAVLLYHRVSEYLRAPRLWDVDYNGAYALAGLAVLGFAFAWWARIHLGTLWSGAVMVKEDHRIVDSGPYGWVRHPIYTGLLLATLATAAAIATLPAVLGAMLIVLGIWLKARLEERFLRAELGEAPYDAYRRRVPMLVPFGPVSR